LRLIANGNFRDRRSDGDALVELFFQPLTDRLQRRPRAEHLAHTLFFQRARIGVGNHATAEDENVTQVAAAQFLHHAREQREVRPGEERQADRVDVFLQRRLGDLLGRLVQTRVDDLETVVPEGPRDGLGTTVVAVEAGLGDNYSVGAFHKKETLRRDAGKSPTRHTGGVATPGPRFRLRSPLARALAPVVAGLGFFALLFLALWGAAALISRNPERITNLGDRIFEVGQVQRVAESVRDSGPILYPDLRDPDGSRSIVLDHEGDQPAVGWRVFYAWPADRDATCIAEQIEKTSTFTDCEGRTIDIEDLARPTDVRPLVENRKTLYIDLRVNDGK